MHIVCVDLEGVLVPGISIAFAERSASAAQRPQFLAHDSQSALKASIDAAAALSRGA